MKAIIFLFLVFFGVTGQAQSLDGKWILKDISAPTIITVANNSNQMKVVSNENGVFETSKVTLREYLLQEMKIGITQFLFNGNTFQFYRDANLAHTGTFDKVGEKITLHINKNNHPSTKEMKLISINANEITLESYSNGYPFTITFRKINL